MPFVVMIHATFNTKADADHIYNQAKSVATTASVARIGAAGERTSYCGVYDEQTDGTLIQDRQWHLDRFGIVRESAPVGNDVVPDWLQPAGAQDAYPLTDVFGQPARVKHLGDTWENTSAVNTNAPGVFGWTNLTAVVETHVEPAGLPAWTTWTGLNEDLYQVGDEVSHNGSNWRATLGNNYWTPGSGTGWVAI
jgi:hypothetical protein